MRSLHPDHNEVQWPPGFELILHNGVDDLVSLSAPWSCVVGGGWVMVMMQLQPSSSSSSVFPTRAHQSRVTAMHSSALPPLLRLVLVCGGYCHFAHSETMRRVAFGSIYVSLSLTHSLFLPVPPSHTLAHAHMRTWVANRITDELQGGVLARRGVLENRQVLLRLQVRTRVPPQTSVCQGTNVDLRVHWAG